MSFLYDAFPDFEFFEDDGSELFHDVSPNVFGMNNLFESIKVVFVFFDLVVPFDYRNYFFVS